ncbi:MAG: hypothetical protein GY932_10405 [Arcobacter sp.]|nr:hypothetical protein [Arcobacter sp.]
MAFVNENVSEEEIEKYGLWELKNKYKDKFRKIKKEHRSHYTLDWTIDRDREIWFSYLTNVMDPDWEYRQSTGEEVWMLNYKGKEVEVRLFDPPLEGSSSFEERPFRKIWELVSISPESIDGVSNKALKEIIKEALNVYGQFGVKSRVPNEDVEIEFRGKEWH